MSDPTTCAASRSAISLPESRSGHTPCGEPGGPTTAPASPAHPHASLSARQAKDLGLLTSGTFGPLISTSSISDGLQSSLVSRLRQRTASLGSTMYKLTWKGRDTPSGRSISALRASVLRTSAKGSTSSARKEKARGGGLSDWPTPRAAVSGPDYATAARGAGGISLSTAAALSTWNTPRATDGSNGGPNGGPNQAGGALPHDASLASWSPPPEPENDGLGDDIGARQRAFAGQRGRPTEWRAAGHVGPSGILGDLGGWVTASARDWKDTPGMAIEREDGRTRLDQLPRQAHLTNWLE